MQFEELKATLQPSIDQDLQGIYDRFVSDTGKRDLAAFLEHLHDDGHIDLATKESLARDLRSSLVGGEEGATDPGAGEADQDESTEEVTDPGASSGDEEANNKASRSSGRRRRRSRTGGRRRRRRSGSRDGDSTGVRRRRRSKEQIGTGAHDMGTGAHGPKRRRARSKSGASGSSKNKKAPEPPPDPSELSVTERYDFVGSVGAGAMGQVHLAVDKLLHRKVAFKQITQDMAKHGTMASKFQVEAQITAQLDHPNIVPVYAIEVSPDGLPAYTMKLINGQTIEDMIVEGIEHHSKGSTPPDELSEETLLQHFLKVCDAMAYAHDRGVVHRDLKPENIMVGAYGEIYVMDWGIARPYTADVDEPVDIGEVEDEGDLIIGTPQYMSPEQAHGDNGNLDHHSDQYSLGLILYELVSFQQAVTGKAPMKIVMRQQDAEKNPLKHLNPKVKIATELRAIIYKTLNKDKSRRYETVSHLAADIRRYLRGEAVLAKRDNPWQALMRFMRSHQQLTLAFIFLLISGSVFTLLLVAGGYQWRLSAQKVRETQVSQLLTTVGRQASLIDGQFLKYEGLLSVLAVTAGDMLDRDPQLMGLPDVYYNEDFSDPENHPPNLIDSRRYEMPISLDHPVTVLAPDVRRTSVRQSVNQLLPMQRNYYQVMLRSLNEEAAAMGPVRARRAIADVGVPLAWAYVGTENGVYSQYPGHGGFPSNFDARERPWYELAATTQGPTWGAPHADVSGLGLILSCAQSLRDEDGELRGVAGIDVTFDFLIEELLEIEGFAPISESFLLDEKGRIVVRSSKKGTKVSISGREMRMPTFPVDEVVDDIERLKSGHVEVEQDGLDQMVIYNRMHSLGWYYVVMGETSEILEEIAREEAE